ncbi:gluconate 2-dehydrogenase subunit 3 family protein [Psychrosphaera sp. B3R10]|uniref:gluconate 2-dehydrogenase subunit 3 family protein n=1 Tax=unclassified Psychrosphaera TaxID=2641570 RepID=UPI001C085949|nr:MULTISPECIES: gluconate 2-dehydrogenase subunit 3 family protein [unclassified Psychrosphaera]MBU2883533.1 gluconate 2-dehydrogenase subunit 3 family protein [Psychrosphaera sp. I2R16]MBU2989712.1 gluconate 2-dehydrogenase subunit 3 family protein [Psychrosphaera sp. B3R10]MDO6719834.1 gluconate 2-dehydrogenase subunit 3 family protein [Psychrosphaera sp. 1_MG-2023]
MTKECVNISRRIFIGSSLLVVSAPLLAGISNPTNALFEVTNDGQFFTAEDMTTLVDVAEIMIPETDTPGATDAQVIPVLDGMMITWAGKETKHQFRILISQIEKLAEDTFSAPYKQLPFVDRLSLVKLMDSRAFADANTPLSKRYRKLKEMIFQIYYSSKEANPDFMLIPGAYRGCVTEKDIKRFQAQGRVDYL